MIDSSGSIGQRNWGRLKRFLKAIVSKLDVSPSGAHVAAVTYSTTAEVVLLFRSGQSTVEVNTALDGMPWQRGFTFTDKALQLADSDLFQIATGMRPNAAKVRWRQQKYYYPNYNVVNSDIGMLLFYEFVCCCNELIYC